ncbi:hypothetical protein OQA88_4138 [Cercophora sp. LCS_1]
MNTDELMLDSTAAGSSAAGDIYLVAPDTPAKSDSQPTAANGNNGPAAWNNKKFREEYDVTKSRLTDQRFSSGDYPDPLLPRKPGHPRQYPRGTTPEIEKQLKELIAQFRAKSG